MAIKYVSTDMARWGAGLARKLTAAEVDRNFWDMLERIVDLEDLDLGVGFATDTEGPVRILGNILTFRFNDNSEDSVTLPAVAYGSLETWAPLTVYAGFKLLRNSGITYVVNRAHTSAATFDPGATDGDGNDLYTEIFDPALAIEDLTDVSFGTGGPADGDFLRYDGTTGDWVNAGSLTFADIGDTLSFADLTDQIAPEQFPDGLKPFKQTVVINTAGELDIDLADGNSAHVTLNGDVNAFTITGWPQSNTTGDVGATLRLTIHHSGNHVFLALPTNTRAPDGVIPTLTSNTAGDGVDVWEFFSDDEGDTIYLTVNGSDFIVV